MISENMKILKEQYGFDTVAVREQAVDFSKIKGKKILDIGTGSGWMAIVLARRGFEAVTIDNDEDALQRAKETAQDEGIVDNIIFKKADAVRLPFADDAFDAVFSFDSMHHLPDCYQAIAEMFRVCKASGWIVISDLNANGLKAIRQLLADQGEKHDENLCRVDTVAQLIKKFDPQAQRVDLEFTTIIVARKCPQDAIEEIERLLETLFRNYNQKIRSEMMDSGLTLTQAQALLFISEVDECSLDKLSDKLFIEKSTLTRILDGLAKKSLVKRERSNDDRRTVSVWLTLEGKSAVNNMRCCLVEAQRELLCDFSIAEQLEILNAMRKLALAFSR